MDKCKKCICTQCRKEFRTNPFNCKYSDCKWCIEEEGTCTVVCGKYLDKGGTYGYKPLGGIKNE